MTTQAAVKGRSLLRVLVGLALPLVLVTTMACGGISTATSPTVPTPTGATFSSIHGRAFAPVDEAHPKSPNVSGNPIPRLGSFGLTAVAHEVDKWVTEIR